MSTDQKTSDTAAKVELRKQQQRFNLHVMLIMEQDNVAKNNANFKAWLEGPGGLTRRMPVVLPTK